MSTDNTTHHLVPRRGLQVCRYCLRSARELAAEEQQQCPQAPGASTDHEIPVGRP